jgi:hypothetical protein
VQPDDKKRIKMIAGSEIKEPPRFCQVDCSPPARVLPYSAGEVLHWVTAASVGRCRCVEQDLAIVQSFIVPLLVDEHIDSGAAGTPDLLGACVNIHCSVSMFFYT